MHFKITIFTYKKWSRKKNFFFRDPFLKKSFVENNSYIYVYDFPQKNFSMCHGTYSPIPDPSKNWSVNFLTGKHLLSQHEELQLMHPSKN